MYHIYTIRYLYDFKNYQNRKKCGDQLHLSDLVVRMNLHKTYDQRNKNKICSAIAERPRCKVRYSFRQK